MICFTMYKAEAGNDNGIESVKKIDPDAKVVDLTALFFSD